MKVFLFISFFAVNVHANDCRSVIAENSPIELSAPEIAAHRLKAQENFAKAGRALEEGGADWLPLSDFFVAKAESIVHRYHEGFAASLDTTLPVPEIAKHLQKSLGSRNELSIFLVDSGMVRPSVRPDILTEYVDFLLVTERSYNLDENKDAMASNPSIYSIRQRLDLIRANTESVAFGRLVFELKKANRQMKRWE